MNKVLRWALRLFPRSFRERYEDEIYRALLLKTLEVRERYGLMGVLRMWLYQGFDLIRSAWSERAVERSRMRHPEGPVGSSLSRTPKGDHLVATLWQDLRYATRLIRRQPLFSAVVVLTLALGIGANTAVFSVVNGVLLKPLPFEDPGELVGVWHRAPGMDLSGSLKVSPGTYFTYREESRVFEDIGIYLDYAATMTGLGRAEWLTAAWVTDGTLPLLGVRPLLGRIFTREDDMPGAAPTVVLSHGYWQTRFGGDRSVLGRSLTVEGQLTEIIGVLPPGIDLFQTNPAVYMPSGLVRSRARFDSFSFQAIARLRPGTTIEEANADVARMIPLALERFPGRMSAADVEEAQLGPDVHPLKNDVVGDVGSALWIVFGTVGIVLLVACANVANLFLVRAEGRRTEVAVRSAVGAGRRHLARLFIAEGLMLATLGSALGLVLAHAAMSALPLLGPERLPRMSEITIDSSVLLFTGAVLFMSALFFGAVPMFKLGTATLGRSLREGSRGAGTGRRRQLLRGAFVVSQMALALVLVTGSGLMIRSFQALRHVHPGFERPADVLTATVSPDLPEAPTSDDTAEIHERILRSIREIPGVSAVGFTSSITMDGRRSSTSVLLEERPLIGEELAPTHRLKFVSPGYFDVMGNPILAGRPFSWGDVHDRTKVVVVTQSFAIRYWDDPARAVGKRIRAGAEEPWREIIGVVGDVHDDGADQPATAVVYCPPIVEDFGWPGAYARRIMVYAIRHDGRPGPGLIEDVREAVSSVHSALPVGNVQTLKDIYDRSMARTSFAMWALAIAAAVALLIGTAGLYGVMSYVVSQRTREIGVRMTLGAKQRDVGRMVLKHGLALAGIGVLVGVGVAAGVTRLMSALLFGVNPVDPLTFGLVSISLAAVAVFAGYFPARRATRVDPVEALRAE